MVRDTLSEGSKGKYMSVRACTRPQFLCLELASAAESEQIHSFRTYPGVATLETSEPGRMSRLGVSWQCLNGIVYVLVTVFAVAKFTVDHGLINLRFCCFSRPLTLQ